MSIRKRTILYSIENNKNRGIDFVFVYFSVIHFSLIYFIQSHNEENTNLKNRQQIALEKEASV